MSENKENSTSGRIWTTIGFLFAFAAGAFGESLGFFSFAKENPDEIWSLFLEHCYLVGISSIIAISIGVPLGIFLTRGFMRRYRDLILNLIGICQTIPSLAVIAIAMTYVGIGKTPAILALVIYGLLPIIRNSVAGLANVDPVMLEAGRGMGMTPLQLLFKVEIPNAMYIIITGIRTSMVINVGTAALAFLVGGGGFGDLIFTGIAMVDPAYMLAGAVPTAGLAVFINWVFGYIEKWIVSPGLTYD
ncbi:ABC transporter permease [Desulfonema magnum]|uniref:Glycine betaine/proline betaine transport system, permease protein n=1 Tax=Desulfonema magnum TaxID=45655 RepID=A0A975GMI9_9BACT|nr:ABC transporter permease [Desulfonema magnum]QTA86951.1 Glycine betaine/proline betaine transport system, permease protein [Desulfonema magnum]